MSETIAFEPGEWGCTSPCACSCVEEVHKELLSARAENERLRAALRPFADVYENALLPNPPDDLPLDDRCETLLIGHFRLARAALSPST